MGSVNFFKARDVSETINATFSFIRAEFKYLWKSTLYLIGPFVLVISVISFSQGTLDPGEINSYSLFINLLFLYLALFLLYVIVTSMMNNYLLMYINGDNSRKSPAKVISATMKDFWLTAKVTFLYGLIILAIIFAIGIFVTIIGIIKAAFAPFIIFLLMFPLVYFFIAFSFVFIISIHERVPFSVALTRSYNLIKNYWWFSFWVYFLIYLLSFVLQLVFLLPQYIITFTVHFNSGNPFILSDNKIMNGLIMAYSSFSYFLYGISYITIGIHYYSQREKKEAAGLAKKIETLEGDVSSEIK